ncbi:MAG: hypothetical protein K0V04_44625, partial [Deltaproteobacteria bacterium]|nr:hypothetical protein [Deltaproteobacteria bacterium]
GMAVLATPAAAAAAGVGSTAAIDRNVTDEIPSAPTVVGDAELGIFAESRPDENVASVSPQIRLGMRPRDEVELHINFGAVAVFRDGAAGREQQARPSNLSFGGSRVFDRREGQWRYAKVGFGFVIPTAFAVSESERDAYQYALGGRNGWNPWLWTPQALGLVVPAEVRAQAGRRWVLGGDAALAGLLPSAGNTEGVALAAQVAAQARVVTRRLGLGLRLTAVWNGRHPDDRSQAGISPFVDTSLCRRGHGRRLKGERAKTSDGCPVYASARLNINLDGPYGYTGNDAMGVWGVLVGLGWAVY